MPFLMQARKVPTTNAGIVEYLMETESSEMEYETARCRPLLTEDFFRYIQQEISAQFFSVHLQYSSPIHISLSLPPQCIHCGSIRTGNACVTKMADR